VHVNFYESCGKAERGVEFDVPCCYFGIMLKTESRPDLFVLLACPFIGSSWADFCWDVRSSWI
jgi:hypothetical protein